MPRYGAPLAAGYDIKTPEGFAETFRHFDEVIGFSYLRGMHLNDSKKDLGSRGGPAREYR